MKRRCSLVITMLTAMLLSAQTPSPYINNKVSPRLQRMLHADMTSQQAHAAKSTTQRIEVLTKLAADADETSLTERYDMQVEARIGEVLVVSVPRNKVAAMAQDANVLRIEAEAAPRKMLDDMPQRIGVDKIRQGTDLPQVFTGKDVVVGIVDVGFDYVNPFFRDSQGQTRINWATDYTGSSTTTLTTASDIWAAQHSSDAATEWHGTHVAGIAAGSLVYSTFDKPYQGIAPEADIAEACISLTGNNPILNPSDPTAAPALRAMNDIFAWAEAQQKPCVINFSAGISQTFSNSRQLEEEALRTLASKPGRAIVVAAGNQGLYPYLMHKSADMEQAGAGIRFHQEDGYGRYFGAELKIRPTQIIHLKHTDSSYTKDYGEVMFTVGDLRQAGGTQTIRIGSGTYLKRLTVSLTEETTDGYAIIYVIDETSTYPATDRMLFTIEGEGEAWIYADTSFAPLEDVPAISNHSLTIPGYTIGWPASVSELITVGNIGHRFKVSGSWGNSIDWGPIERGKGEGYRALSSSCGPTLDGRTKPDVCAPGVNIISAYNNFVNESYDHYLIDYTIGMLDTEFEPENGGYFALLAQTGTSMSAPAVSGTIALWMQADPTLTTERIMDIIAHTSRQPDAELSYPNNEYGYGEIDAYAGLLYLLDPSGVLPVSRHQPQEAVFRLCGRQLSVSFTATESQKTEQGATATLRLYTTAGRLAATFTLGAATNSVDLSSLPSGIYAVQLSTGNSTTTGSTLIRL